jgi:hypothetical protein
MSEDCETVNGVPTRQFWDSISDAPEARDLLRANYRTCKGDDRPRAHTQYRPCAEYQPNNKHNNTLEVQSSSSSTTNASAPQASVVAGVAVATGALTLMAVAMVAYKRARRTLAM